MTLLIDPPNAEGHGRLWSHLASDESFDELHRFAARLGIPQRGFLIHSLDWGGQETIQVGDRWALSATLDILKAIADSRDVNAETKAKLDLVGGGLLAVFGKGDVEISVPTRSWRGRRSARRSSRAACAHSSGVFTS